MSRLFSRLENRGQDPDDGTLPASRSEADRPDNAKVDASAFASTWPGSDIHANALPGQLPAMQPLVPGYAISANPGMAVLSTPFVARPVWPVWLWLASLLLLLGLSLLILALPERLLPLPKQPPAAVSPPMVAPAPAAVVVPAATPAGKPAAAAAIAPSPASVARTGGASITSTAASAIATPARMPEPPRAGPRTSPAVPAPAAAVAPVAPPGPSGDAACSEAMLAMNLCSKSSP